MRVELSYGKGVLPIDFDSRWNVTVIRKPAMPVQPDAAGAVRRALANPIEARALTEEARGARSACVLICDITRPVPNGLLLFPILEQLVQAGVPQANIVVLVATGLHRPNEGNELAELVGDRRVLDNFRVENHFARNDADHVDLGATPAGTPVKLDRRFVAADIKIVTGLVEPHFMAGYSGGRKVIAPGIAHKDTITTFHNARFMSDPRADNCVLEGNPLHEEQLAIVRMLGRVLAVNTVIDEHRKLSYVNYGEVIASHLAAVRFVEQYARVSVGRRFSTVVTSAAGYPLDKTYYQTVKGMVGPIDILQPGGNLIVASQCSEGLGSPEYGKAQEHLIRAGAQGFYAGIRHKPFADIDEWQTQMQLKAMRAGSVHLYSDGLNAGERALTGVNLVESVEEALVRCLPQQGVADVAVIPEGPYVVPVYRPAG
jgi:nickel-dependent lactate racemase